MRSNICYAAVAAAALVTGCQDPQAANKPLDQSKIISVKPAIPEGARKFVDEQNRLQRERQRKSKTQAAQPAGYTYLEAPPQKPANSGSWTDIFNPAKWGKGKQETPPPQPPQQFQQPQQFQAVTSRPG